MKLPVIAVLLAVAVSAGAQTFEGAIRWSIQTQMDPSTQSSMPQMTEEQKKDLQEKMNDPKMKEMMEKNPQLKAQMEAMMNAQNGGDASSMMPTEMLVHIKGDKTLTEISGGVMNAIKVLYDGTSGKTYTIDSSNKTYTEMSNGSEHAAHGPEPTVTKTDETTTILGYKCTRYDISYDENGSKRAQTFWVTKDIPGIDLKALAHQRMGGDGPNIMDKIDGIPLRIEMNNPHMSMTMEATEIKKGSQNASDFTVPSGYKQVEMGMGMMGQ